MKLIPMGHFRRSRMAVMMLGLAFVAIVGWVDTLLDRELSFLIIYLIPVLLAGWFAGRWQSHLMSVASGFAWWVNEYIDAYSYHHRAIPYWNLGVKLGIFVILDELIYGLRRSLEHERQAERDRIDSEMRIAKQVQALMFPQLAPAICTLDYSAVCLQAREIGGDYYDYIPLAENRYVIAIGDVSGKGIPAALLMARLQVLIRTLAPVHSTSAADLMQALNEGMNLGMEAGKYATVFCGIYECGARRLIYSNGGHNPPFVIRTSPHARGSPPQVETVPRNEVIRLDVGGPVIGLLNGARYSEGKAGLRTDDVLVCYTDGVTEALNAANEEFGTARLIEVAARNAHRSSSEIRDTIMNELSAFRGTADLSDDTTLIVARVT